MSRTACLCERSEATSDDLHLRLLRRASLPAGRQARKDRPIRLRRSSLVDQNRFIVLMIFPGNDHIIHPFFELKLILLAKAAGFISGIGIQRPSSGIVNNGFERSTSVISYSKCKVSKRRIRIYDGRS